MKTYPYASIDRLIDKYVSITIVILFYICLLLLPTHFFTVWRSTWTYSGGIFIDYWAPKLFTSQLAIALLWLLTWVKKMRKSASERALLGRHFRLKGLSAYQWSIIFIFFGIALQQLHTAEPRASLVWVTSALAGPVAFGFWCINQKEIAKNHLLPALLASVTLQAGLGLYQSMTQHDLGGYWFLGQPDYAPYSPLATSQISSALRYLPYGSTPHPNVLAAWMILGIMCLRLWRKRKATYILLPIFLATLFCTESVSAWTTLAILLFFCSSPGKQMLQRVYVRLQKLSTLSRSLAIIGAFLVFQAGWILFIPLALSIQEHTHQPLSPSLERRAVLQTETLPLLWKKPLGQGINQHLVSHANAHSSSPTWNLIQPIHNTALALAADIGIWTLLLLLLFFSLEYFKYSYAFVIFSSIFPIFTLDHYGYSTLSGQFFIVISLLIFEFNKVRIRAYKR